MSKGLSAVMTEDLLAELHERHETSIVILDRKMDDDKGLIYYSDQGNPFTILGLLTSVIRLQEAKCQRIVPSIGSIAR